MRTLPVAALGLLCLLLSSCSEDATAPAPTRQPLTFNGAVVDTAGNSLEGAVVFSRIFSADSATAAGSGFPFTPGAPYAITNSAGIFSLQTDTVEARLVDSVLFQTLPPGCGIRLPHDTVVPGSAISGNAIDGIAIAQPGISAGASTQSRQVCAYGIHPFWGPLGYHLTLRFDVPGAAALQGRWVVAPTFTSSNDEGSLVGSQTTVFVVLDLTHDTPSPACTSMRLVADVDSNGDWGPMSVVAQQGCVPDPKPFYFVEDTLFPIP